MSKRLHLSRDPIGDLYVTPQVAEADVKPRGLWYGIDYSWLEWCYEETGWTKPDHKLYEIEVDTSGLLVIDSADMLRDFHVQYSRNMYPGSRINGISWLTVAERYDGVEINPYQWRCRLDHEIFWYYGWDVASGCVWNPRSIRSVVEVSLPPDLVGERQREAI